MFKKSIILVSLVMIVIAAACAQQKQWVEVTPPVATYPDYVATFAETGTDTPIPTASATLGPSLTPTWFNMYANAGYSDVEAKDFEAALINLRNAFKTGDKEFVANMIVYPVWVDVNEDSYWIENKKEFLLKYNLIISKQFRETLAKLELNDDYLASSWRGIMILYYDDLTSIYVYFSPDQLGKIDRISYYEIPQDATPYISPTSTPTLTFTPTPIGGLNAYRSPAPTNTPYWFPTTHPNMNSVSTYFGTWVITRYEEADYENCKGRAETDEAYIQIGKKIEFLPDQVRVGEGFLNHPKELLTHIIYQWWEQYQYEDKFTSALPLDHPEKQIDVPFIGVIIDRKYSPFGFEVTKSDRLVVNDYCIYYFLDKVPPSTSSE